jgi:hypothetical protein
MVKSNKRERRERMPLPEQDDLSIYFHRVHNFFLQLERLQFSLVDRRKRRKLTVVRDQQILDRSLHSQAS